MWRQLKCRWLQQPGFPTDRETGLKVNRFTFYLLLLNMWKSRFFIWVTQSQLSLEVWKWRATQPASPLENKRECAACWTRKQQALSKDMHTHTRRCTAHTQEYFHMTLSHVHAYAHSKLWNCLSKNRCGNTYCILHHGQCYPQKKKHIWRQNGFPDSFMKARYWCAIPSLIQY